MLQLVKLIYTIVNTRIIVTIVICKLDKLLLSILIENSIVYIGIRAIFRVNSKGMLCLFVRYIKFKGIRLAERIVRIRIDLCII